DRVQLAAHGLGALGLPRHDERPPDVTVLDEALAVLDAQVVSRLRGRGTARVGNRDHDVDVVIRPLAHDLPGELLAHAQARLVHREVVDDGVGPREVHELEDARRVPYRAGMLVTVQRAVVPDVYRLVRVDVSQPAETYGCDLPTV